MRIGAVTTLIAFALMVGSPLPAGQQAPGPAQEAFARGMRLQQKGDLEGARQAYEAGLKLEPRRMEVLSNLGLVYSQLGQPGQAVKCFRKALEIEPQQHAVRLNLGVAYMRAGEFASAQRELQAVVDAQPSNLAARSLLGLSLLKLNRLPEGIVQLEVVRQANPKDSSLIDTLASAYIKANQLDKAEPLVAELEKNDSAEAHFVVGSYYLAKLDHQRAIQEFTLALKENPRLLGVRAQLAYAYFFDFKWDRSIKMCEEELALNPNDGNAVSLLGSLYRQRGRLDEAAKLLDQAIKMRPTDYEVLYQIGLLEQARNEFEAAAATLEKVTRMAPEFPPAHITLVRVYGRLKRLEETKREQAIVDRLNAERKNLPTVRDKALYDAFKTPE